MMINELIFRSEMEGEISKSNLFVSQKQLNLSPFAQNDKLCFLKMNFSLDCNLELGVVN